MLPRLSFEKPSLQTLALTCWKGLAPTFELAWAAVKWFLCGKDVPSMRIHFGGSLFEMEQCLLANQLR